MPNEPRLSKTHQDDESATTTRITVLCDFSAVYHMGKKLAPKSGAPNYDVLSEIVSSIITPSLPNTRKVWNFIGWTSKPNEYDSRFEQFVRSLENARWRVIQVPVRTSHMIDATLFVGSDQTGLESFWRRMQRHDTFLMFQIGLFARNHILAAITDSQHVALALHRAAELRDGKNFLFSFESIMEPRIHQIKHTILDGTRVELFNLDLVGDKIIAGFHGTNGLSSPFADDSN